MIRIVSESFNNFEEDRHEFVAKSLYGAFGDSDPQRDNLDYAIDILSKYVSDSVYEMMEDEFFSEESIIKAVSTLSDEQLDSLEDELNKAGPTYIKYADYPDYLDYEYKLLEM